MGTKHQQGIQRTHMVGLPTSHEQNPMGNENPQELGITLTLLPDGMGATGNEDFAMRLPKFKEV